MKYEVESKCQVIDKEKINNFIQTANFVKEGNQEDIYFDTKEAKYFLNAIFIRVREGKRLDFKFKKDFKKGDRHDGCIESSFELPLKQEKLENFNQILELLEMNKINTMNFDEFLKVNELKEFVPIRKKFKLYEKEGLKIRLDIVDNLDEFVEIEKVVETEDLIFKAKEQVMQLEKKLNLKFVNTGYVELYLRKNNFDLYIKGPYLLDEDRKLI